MTRDRRAAGARRRDPDERSRKTTGSRQDRPKKSCGEKAGGKKAYVGIIHAQAPEEAKTIQMALSERLEYAEMEIYELSPVIGTHVGPGTLGIALHTVDLG